MSKRKIILLLAALAIAVGVVLLVRSSMTPQAVVTAAPTESATDVVAAARDLPIGTLIKDADLKWISWPAGAQSANLFVRGQSDKTVLVGSVLRQSFHADEPILMNEIVNPHSQGFLAAVLKPGMRAMSIAVNPGGEVAGFIFPGDRVDVILSQSVNRKDDPQLADRHLSETVLTDVRVLALDQKSDDQTNDPKIAQLATLEVTPQQAEHLALAVQLGTLSLSLRSLVLDVTLPNPSPPDQVSATTLMEGSHTWDSEVSPVFPIPGGDDNLLQKVQIMRGKDKTETTFERRK